jgi:hypothetical protein
MVALDSLFDDSKFLDNIRSPMVMLMAKQLSTTMLRSYNITTKLEVIFNPVNFLASPCIYFLKDRSKS